MAVEQIKETDTLNQGRVKINAILDQSNTSVEQVADYGKTLQAGIDSAKQIATDAGKDAVSIATTAGAQANTTANEAKQIAQNANTKADQAVSTANNNKQEFDQLRHDFNDLVAEAGDSNPEIVQARTDTQGVKRATLSERLTNDFANRMTKADAVQLIAGQTTVSKMMDYSGKTAGNTSTNPHTYYSDFTANTLKKPSAVWDELGQADYNKIATRDDSGVSTGSTANGIIPQQLAKIDVVATAQSIAPQLFDGLSQAERVQLVKDNFVGFVVAVRAKATSPNNKRVKVGVYMPATDAWSTLIQEDAAEYNDYTAQLNTEQYIDDTGKMHLIYYTDAANGVTASNITVDYTGVQLQMSVNAQDILKASGFAEADKVASKTDLTAHASAVDNPHKVTKSQVGLGNVQNYGMATDADAILGTATNKMTSPKNVTAAINAKSVQLTGDQDIEGVKNFAVEPTVGGKPMLDGFRSLQISSGFSNGVTGWIKFERENNLVVISYSLAPSDNSGSWKEVLPGAQIPDEFKLLNQVYGVGAIAASSIVGQSTCVLGVASDKIQFAAYNRASGTAAFVGQVIGAAKNRGR